MKITYLGPAGATFSALAYDKLASIFGVPRVGDSDTELLLAQSNEEILPLMIKNGGYGVMAMETRAQGRVDPPVNSFIELLENYNRSYCPVSVLSAIRMKLNFALMAPTGLAIEEIRKVLAHPKALGACRKHLEMLGVELLEASSNGQAAEDIATKKDLAFSAALAPSIAAEKYGLNVLCGAFEDEEATTTFFLLSAQGDILLPSKENRGLIVFKTRHVSGALVKALTPFAKQNINLVHIHSFYTGNGEYAFAIETECSFDELGRHLLAVKSAKKFMIRNLAFGPFAILDV